MPDQPTSIDALGVDLAPEAFADAGHRVVDLIADYYATIAERPVFPAVTPRDVAPLFDAPAPQQGESIDRILDDWTGKILPNSTRQGHPRFFGWVNGGGSQVGALAEALAAALNPNLGGWRAGPAASTIERVTVQWLAELLGLTPGTGGIFLSGGTMANTAALRLALVHGAGWDIRREGLQSPSRPGRLTVYMADHEAHISLTKAVDLLGLGRDAIRLVPSHADFTIDVAALERMLREDRAAGMTPFAIVGHVGSINVGAIDDLDALADVAARERVWLHLDGACGALGAMLPELAHRYRGLARADSVSFDAHKWLAVPYEAACLLVRDPAAQREAFGIQASYLHATDAEEFPEFDWFDRGPQMSRSWRAFKVWVSLRFYGAEGYRAIFRRTIRCAKRLHALVTAADDFEVLQPEPELYLYSFRYAPPALRGDDAALDRLNQRLVDELQRRQLAMLLTTRIHGRITQRLSIASHRTTEADIDAVVADMRRVGEELLAER